ncbi:MAG: sulfurtransferase complex subunit TusB [Pseudomonadales bacterium]
MILHTVNKSPLRESSLGSCLQFMAQADAIVLLEDGVYAAIKNVDFGLGAASGRVYALESDIKARGLDARLRDDIKVIGYEDFVTLCTEYDVVKSWS